GTDPNTSNLDTQNGGFTVFGRTIYNSISVMDAIAALPTGPDTAVNPAFTDLPLKDYPPGQTVQPVTPANFVNVSDVSTVPKLTFSVTSDNPALVNPTISGGHVVLNYGAGQSGIGHVTVTATDVGGNTASRTFRVRVNPLATTGVNVVLSNTQRFVRFTDASGTVGTIGFRGPGSATVHFDGSGLTQAVVRGVTEIVGTNVTVGSIALTNTSSAYSLTITGRA